MSSDTNNSDPFDFDFDLLDADEPSAKTEESAFDLENPFGDDVVISSGRSENLSTSTGENSFDMGDSPVDDLMTSDFPIADLPVAEGKVSADNPYLSESAAGKKKKGLGGWFSKGKEKPAKEAKPKKEKAVKEKKPPGERIPLDLSAILCIAFSVFLLVSLLIFNIAAILSRGPESTIMQTLCFIGAFNIIGLAAAAVPILFYYFPRERSLPNVLLGISAVALFGGLMVLLGEFYSYGFLMQP